MFTSTEGKRMTGSRRRRQRTATITYPCRLFLSLVAITSHAASTQSSVDRSLSMDSVGVKAAAADKDWMSRRQLQISPVRPPPLPPEELQVDVNDGQCLTFLQRADGDDDGDVDYVEFKDFLKELGYTGDNGGRLPFPLQVAFNSAACLCLDQQGANGDCCVGENAGINITRSELDPTYLRIVCQNSRQGVVVVSNPMETMMPTPTPPPIVAPTPPPTAAPSGGTTAPTAFPSATLAPTREETIVPTPAPGTAAPTSTPSEGTAAPTSTGGTSAPTKFGTVAPSIATAPPSRAPTLSPTTGAPTAEPVPAFSDVEYDIAVVPDAVGVDGALEDAMDALFAARFSQQRRLQSSQLPSQIVSRQDEECPQELMDPNVACQQVLHQVPFLEDTSELMQSIDNGTFQEQLNSTGNPGIILLTPEYISGLQPMSEPPSDPDGDDFPVAAVIGVVVAGAFLLFACLVLAPMVRKSIEEREKEEEAARLAEYSAGAGPSPAGRTDEPQEESYGVASSGGMAPAGTAIVLAGDDWSRESSSSSEYYSSSDESPPRDDYPPVPTTIGRDGLVMRHLDSSSSRRRRERMPSSITTMGGPYSPGRLPKQPTEVSSMKTEETALPSATSSMAPTTTTAASDVTSQQVARGIGIGLAAAAGVAASLGRNTGADSDDALSGTSYSMEPSSTGSYSTQQYPGQPSNLSSTDSALYTGSGSLSSSSRPPVAAIISAPPRRQQEGMQSTPGGDAGSEGEAPGLASLGSPSLSSSAESTSMTSTRTGSQQPSQPSRVGVPSRIDEEEDDALPRSLPIYDELLASEVMQQEVLDSSRGAKSSKESGEERAVAESLSALKRKTAEEEEAERVAASAVRRQQQVLGGAVRPGGSGEERAVAQTLSAVEQKTEEGAEAERVAATAVRRQRQILADASARGGGEERAVAQTLSAIQRRAEDDDERSA